MFNMRKKREAEINDLKELLGLLKTTSEIVTKSFTPHPCFENLKPKAFMPITGLKEFTKDTGSGHPALFPDKTEEQRIRTLEIKMDLLLEKMNIEMVKTITETDYKKDTKYSLATVKPIKK